MSIASAQDLVSVLHEHRLLDEVQLAELLPKLGQFADARALAKSLVQRELLTPYQVNQIFNNKAATLNLDKYLVMHRVGEGGMGQVLKAKNRQTGELVAVKILKAEMAQNPDLCKRFEREIRVASKLHHPNIVRFFDAGRSGDSLYYAMEFVDGEDLAKLVKNSQTFPALKVSEACEYIAQAALGLQHAHERGMVHRDIKPSNLLLGKSGGNIKLLDLGLARSLNPPSDGGFQSNTLTQDGMVMGTPDYISPEQAIDSHTADIRSDIYSLGCAFYFLLSSRPPFDQGSVMQKLAWHLHAEPPPIENMRPDLPRGLGDVLRKMLAKKREERYQTPGEVAEALGPYRERRTRTSVQAVAVGTSESSGGDWWAWVFAIVGSIVLLILGILIALWW